MLLRRFWPWIFLTVTAGASNLNLTEIISVLPTCSVGFNTSPNHLTPLIDNSFRASSTIWARQYCPISRWFVETTLYSRRWHPVYKVDAVIQIKGVRKSTHLHFQPINVVRGCTYEFQYLLWASYWVSRTKHNRHWTCYGPSSCTHRYSTVLLSIHHRKTIWLGRRCYHLINVLFGSSHCIRCREYANFPSKYQKMPLTLP